MVSFVVHRRRDESSTGACDHPDVLVFDGDCGFCRRCADWVAVRGEVPMAASAEVDLANLGLTAEEAASSALLAVPPFSWLGGPAYRWVAANRHRFG